MSSPPFFFTSRLSEKRGWGMTEVNGCACACVNVSLSAYGAKVIAAMMRMCVKMEGGI